MTTAIDHDDAPMLQKMLDDQAASGARTLLLPIGTFAIRSPLRIPAGRFLDSAGCKLVTEPVEPLHPLLFQVTDHAPLVRSATYEMFGMEHAGSFLNHLCA